MFQNRVTIHQLQSTIPKNDILLGVVDCSWWIVTYLVSRRTETCVTIFQCVDSSLLVLTQWGNATEIVALFVGVLKTQFIGEWDLRVVSSPRHADVLLSVDDHQTNRGVHHRYLFLKVAEVLYMRCSDILIITFRNVGVKPNVNKDCVNRNILMPRLFAVYFDWYITHTTVCQHTQIYDIALFYCRTVYHQHDGVCYCRQNKTKLSPQVYRGGRIRWAYLHKAVQPWFKGLLTCVYSAVEFLHRRKMKCCKHSIVAAKAVSLQPRKLQKCWLHPTLDRAPVVS